MTAAVFEAHPERQKNLFEQSMTLAAMNLVERSVENLALHQSVLVGGFALAASFEEDVMVALGLNLKAVLHATAKADHLVEQLLTEREQFDHQADMGSDYVNHVVDFAKKMVLVPQQG